MPHFKAKMHHIRFPAPVRSFIRLCLWSTSRSHVDTAWRRRSWWTLLVRVSSSACPFVRSSLRWSL